ncbi:hypothetical protein D3C84_436390 [compost metagenome]
MTRVVAVEVAVRQFQQAVEQGQSQVMHQPQGYLGQEVVTQVRTQSLPGRDQHDQQGYRLKQLEILQVGNVGKKDRIRIAQAIDEVFEDAGQHRLCGGEDDVADDADQEQAGVGRDIAQQTKIDLQAGGSRGRRMLLGHALALRLDRKGREAYHSGVRIH